MRCPFFTPAIEFVGIDIDMHSESATAPIVFLIVSLLDRLLIKVYIKNVKLSLTFLNSI